MKTLFSLYKVLLGHIALVLVLLLALTLRLYKIDTPLADWHSWRQADTASVTREYIKNNHPLLEPHYHDLSNIPSGLDNLEGYRMVEFPIINYVLAQILKNNSSLDLIVTSRLASVFFTLITIASLYIIVDKISKNRVLALLTALTFSVIPYSIYYSRVILPEPAMVAFSCLTIMSLIMLLECQSKFSKKASFFWFLATWLFFSLALLLKPTAIFIAPVLIYLSLSTLGFFGSLKNIWLWLLITTPAPLLLWRSWIESYPAGIPANLWLLNGNGIRLRPAWWRWLFAERLAKLILGYWATSFLVIGSFTTLTKKWSTFDTFTLIWTGSWLAYLVIFATGNVQHDYYQIPLIPVVSLLVARGIYWSYHYTQQNNTRLIMWPLISGVIGMSLLFSWYEVRGYYNINNPAIVEAGEAVDRLTPADALVIAPYQGDTAFLFQTNRTGWPIGTLIEEKIAKGATHYVSTSYDDEARELENTYKVLEKNGQYILIDLTTPIKQLELESEL